MSNAIALPVSGDRIGYDGYARIARWLHSTCGMHYPETKKDLLIQRLNRVVERFQLGDFDQLAMTLELGNESEIISAVAHAASTNHTYFFREPQALDHFRDVILPSLAGRSHVRVWSAAASTGDEAYTLAMIACEAWGMPSARSRLVVLGTDISSTVIAQAEAGRYGEASLEQVRSEILVKYFNALGEGQYAINKDIKSMCTFRRLNLQNHPYPFQRRFDVVFCRNVLYYFDRDHQRAVLEAIYDATEPGGWLLTSVTETVRDLGTRWTTINGGIHRRMP